MVCAKYCHSGNQYYWDITVGNFSAIFSINVIAELTPDVNIKREALSYVVTYSEEDFRNPCELLSNLRSLLTLYNGSIQKIAKKLGWQFEGEGLSLFKAFTEKLRAERAETWTSLDLSNCDLELLPPQISLLENLKDLNLSGNNIYLFPPELQLLPLEKLDISDNSRLQPSIPKWLGKKEDFTLIAYRIEMNHVPRGLSPKQIKCETNLEAQQSTSAQQRTPSWVQKK